jgi:formamidopyrimidine-DNA glycosylase
MDVALSGRGRREISRKVTAFREGMAVHGRFGKPCPTCGTPVQRIVHGEHEVNYCPSCQTEGRLLADRSLSRLLKADWPRTLDELERRREKWRRPE